jgi:hypothetical protein
MWMKSVLVGLLVLTGVACSSDDEASNGREYAAEIRENFLESCRGAGGEDPYCLCVLEGLEGEYTQEEFTEVEVEMAASGATPPFITDLTSRCA